MREAGWRMFGHVLRMTDDTPAKHTTIHYFDIFKGSTFVGRSRNTLLLLIDKDLKLVVAQPDLSNYQLDSPIKNQFKTIADLRCLETLASDRARWMRIVLCVANMQDPKPKEPIIRIQPLRRTKQFA